MGENAAAAVAAPAPLSHVVVIAGTMSQLLLLLNKELWVLLLLLLLPAAAASAPCSFISFSHIWRGVHAICGSLRLEFSQPWCPVHLPLAHSLPTPVPQASVLLQNLCQCTRVVKARTDTKHNMCKHGQRNDVNKHKYASALLEQQYHGLQARRRWAFPEWHPRQSGGLLPPF